MSSKILFNKEKETISYKDFHVGDEVIAAVGSFLRTTFFTNGPLISFRAKAISNYSNEIFVDIPLLSCFTPVKRPPSPEKTPIRNKN